MGVVPRRQVADDVKTLGQDERALLRKHGVRFGQHNIFMPLMLKPAPTRLRLILWSLWEGFEEFPEAPPPGLVTIPAAEGAPKGFYEKVGYRLCGARALRIDMLERLADLIRPMDVRAGFEATPDMMSITGCTLDQLADILQSLGFDGERGERPKPVRTAKPDEAAPQAGAAGVEPPAEAGAPEAADAAQEPEAGAPQTEAAPETAPEIGTIPAPDAPADTESAATTISAPQPGEDSAAQAADDEAAPADGPAATAEGDAAETETFYIFRLRPRHRAGPGRKPDRTEARSGKPRDGAARRGPKGGQKGGSSEGTGGEAREGGKGKGPRRDRDDKAAKHRPERPRREEKPIDPNSPFAVLMQLKNK
jgi:ATP-dependent RNA helicase SUPV3L1/SUV3